jgi:hypothetical protein
VTTASRTRSPASASTPPSASKSHDPIIAPVGTTISSSRFGIDRFNLTFSQASDNDFVSIGAEQGATTPNGNAFGTLKATAVLIRSPASPVNGPYKPTRVDVLLYKRAFTRRNFVTDFYVTLYSDDGTSEHNPAGQVRGAKFLHAAHCVCCVCSAR